MLSVLLLACTAPSTAPAPADTAAGDAGLSDPGAQVDVLPPAADTDDSGDSGEAMSDEVDIVIAVMVDTYRADWMLADGFTGSLQSTLDAQGWAIYPAITTSNWTWPAVRLLTTGCGPFSNLVDPDGACEDFTLSESGHQEIGDMPLLPAMVDARVRVLSNSPIWSAGHSDICDTLTDQGGLCDIRTIGPTGDKHNDQLIDAALTLPETLAAERAEHGKVVQVVHLYGPHATYTLHEKYGSCTFDASQLPEGWEDFDPVHDLPLPELLGRLFNDEGQVPYGPGQEALLSYDRCLYETDMADSNAQLARLLQGLDEQWMADNRAMVVMYSDHGERFGEQHPDAAIPEGGIFQSDHGETALYEDVTGGFVGLWIPWLDDAFPAADAVPRLSADDLWATAYHHLNIDPPDTLQGQRIGTRDAGEPAWAASINTDQNDGAVRAVWHTEGGAESLVCTLRVPDRIRCEAYADLTESDCVLDGADPAVAYPDLWPQMAERLSSVAARIGWTGEL